MILGAHDLTRALKGAGVEPGDGVFVHSALGQVGRVIGGPRGLIQALVDAVGPDGLVAMPGFSEDAYDPVELAGLQVSASEHERIRAQVPGFNPAMSNVRQNGAVPEAFRSWPGVVRSPHPTSSVLLLGPRAQALSTPHDAIGWPTGPDTPWHRLRQVPRMKILLIGVGWNRCSALHAAESIATHRRSVVRTLKTGPAGDWVTAPDVTDDLDRLFPPVGAAWEATGAVRMGTVGAATSRLTGYDALVEFASAWLSERNRSDGVPAHGD